MAVEVIEVAVVRSVHWVVMLLAAVSMVAMIVAVL